MAAAATATTTTTREADIKACLSDLSKIPENEFEQQLRNWMERDGVARTMQAKLRADLITNFNRTALGKHILGKNSTNRLTLSPMELALNTLVSEFLYAQNCHFTLSVFCTEAPFKNTLPDFDQVRYFRFKEAEVTEILKAICGPTNYDWNINNAILKNYTANRSSSLILFILKSLVDKNAEALQQKVTVGTNTRPFKVAPNIPPKHPASSDAMTSEPSRPDTKAEFYNSNFRYLNRYLIILSRKVKDMSEQFERLHHQRNYGVNGRQPRVRILKTTGRRKYDDLNRSLERVTENLKQMANAKRKSKRVGTIVKAIETLAVQFQKCAVNFENVSKDLKLSSVTHTTRVEKSTSADSRPASTPIVSATTAAASQTDVKVEKTFADWLHEMRYTRNGQKFLDRVEKSFVKAMEKQKLELANENDVKLRHQRELQRIRYKQKLIEAQMQSQSNQSAQTKELISAKQDQNETISEQFKQFELKHFDLLSRIYESEQAKVSTETVPTSAEPERTVHFSVKGNAQIPRMGIELDTSDTKYTSSSDCVELPQISKKSSGEISAPDFQKHVKQAIEEIVSEERNVDQIVYDAKVRIKELEHESNQLTENFLGYLERQRQQKLAAREAAQSLWNDYIIERENMQKRYTTSNRNDGQPRQSNELHDHRQDDTRARSEVNTEAVERLLSEYKMKTEAKQEEQRNQCKENFQIEKNFPDKMANEDESEKESSDSSSYMQLTNPIQKAKEVFFERERKFKDDTERILNRDFQLRNPDLSEYSKIDADVNIDRIGFEELELEKSALKTQIKHRKPMITNSLVAQFLSDSLSGTCTDGSDHILPVFTATNAASGAEMSTNWQSLLLERPQDDFVNKSQRREVIAANETNTNTNTTTNTKAKIATRDQTAKTNVLIETATKTTRTLNKNNVDGASFSVADAQQVHSNNYKIKSASTVHSHTTSMEQQSEWHKKTKINNYANDNDHDHDNDNQNENENENKNKKAYNTNNGSANTFIAETVSLGMLPTTSKSEEGNASCAVATSRKAVLKQSMARMQQLFSPNQQHPHQHHHLQKQQQQQQQHQHQYQYQRQQKIMLANVTEEESDADEENYDQGKKELQSKFNFEFQNNTTTKPAGDGQSADGKYYSNNTNNNNNNSNSNNYYCNDENKINEKTTNANSQNGQNNQNIGGGDAGCRGGSGGGVWVDGGIGNVFNESENVVSHNKNCFQLIQTTQIQQAPAAAVAVAATEATTTATPTTKINRAASKENPEETLKKSTQHSRQLEQQTERPTNWATTATTKTSVALPFIDGNKTVEASSDWQQIACGPSGPNSRQSETKKINQSEAERAKSTRTTTTTTTAEWETLGIERIHKNTDKNTNKNTNKDKTTDVDVNVNVDNVGDLFEKDVKKVALDALEPGEVLQISEVPEASNHLEIGELIERNDDTVVGFSPITEDISSSSRASSVDLQMSVGRNLEVGHESDGNSEFWT